ncbi:MAG TPA: FAD-binding oxidoreductase [Terriglobales bacterium]|nr:FAD-binding oxidoreductase [Terriglobales bacterium]
MVRAKLKRRDGGVVDATLIDTFKQDFQGHVILPGDADYAQARQIWNASIDKYPGMIARCRGTMDIMRAVTFARENNLLVSVRGGGHNVAGRALCDDGLVIDLSLMNGVHVDPKHRTVWVQAGTTLGDMDRETALYGLAVPCGVISETGIAGLTLGGGVGWLVRKYGLSCDNLIGCEVVTAEGKLVTANEESHADLFWGLRGGGGNFGIVSSFLFRAHPVSTVLAGLIVYPRADAKAVLRNYRNVVSTAPEELTAYCALMSTPEGEPATAIIACYCGDLKEGEKVLAPLRNFGTPVQDAIQPMPFLAMQTMLDGAFPDRSHNYWKSAFLKELTDDVIDILIEHGNRMASPHSAIVLEYYAGAMGRVAPAATAFAQRQAEYNIGVMSQWLDAKEGQKHIELTRAAYDALQPFATGRYLPNFVSDESQDQIRAAFGSNYERLAALKAKYDPTNFFSLNQNVKPG